jgi:hypothetical protein
VCGSAPVERLRENPPEERRLLLACLEQRLLPHVRMRRIERGDAPARAPWFSAIVGGHPSCRGVLEDDERVVEWQCDVARAGAFEHSRTADSRRACPEAFRADPEVARLRLEADDGSVVVGIRHGIGLICRACVRHPQGGQPARRR